MVRGLIQSCLSLRFLVLIIAVVITITGVYQVSQMPVDVLPEFSQPYVEIQTESLGLSAEEVEQLITVPMEQDILIGTPWVLKMQSESVPGLSSVVIVFKPGTDLMKARQMVSERMTQAVALPHVSKSPTILQPLSSTGRVMIVGLSSKTLSMIQMGVLARWTIAPRLMGVPGVASVAVWGQRDRQLQVLIDPIRLKAQKVSMQSVLETTGNAMACGDGPRDFKQVLPLLRLIISPRLHRSSPAMIIADPKGFENPSVTRSIVMSRLMS